MAGGRLAGYSPISLVFFMLTVSFMALHSLLASSRSLPYSHFTKSSLILLNRLAISLTHPPKQNSQDQNHPPCTRYSLPTRHYQILTSTTHKILSPQSEAMFLLSPTTTPHTMLKLTALITSLTFLLTVLLPASWVPLACWISKLGSLAVCVGAWLGAAYGWYAVTWWWWRVD